MTNFKIEIVFMDDDRAFTEAKAESRKELYGFLSDAMQDDEGVVCIGSLCFKPGRVKYVRTEEG